MNYKPGDRAVNPETGEAFVFDGREWVKEEKSKPGLLDKVSGALAQLNQGLLLGYNDEVQAAFQRVMPEALGGAPAGMTYRQLQRLEEGKQNQFQQDNPLLSGSMRAVGGAAPVAASMLTGPAGQLAMRSPGLLAQVRSGAGTGAGLGAVASMGEAPASEQQSLPGLIGTAGTGAVVGGAIGAAVPGLTEAAARLRGPAERLAQYVRGVVGGGPGSPAGGAPVQPQANIGGMGGRDRALNAIEEAGMTPGGVSEALQQARAAGQPLSIADAAGNPTQRLVRGARSLSGPASGIIDPRLAARQAAQEGRVAGELRGLAGVEPMPYGASQAVREASRQASDPFYTAARPQVIDDPRMWRQLRSAPVYRESFDATRNELLRVRPQEAPPPLFDDRGGLLRKPTINDVDIIKKGIDDRLYDANGNFRMTEQAAKDKLVSGPLEGARRELVELADEASPAYATARGYYDNAHRFREVTEAGETALNKSPGQILEELRGMAPPEQELYRRAALADALNRMRSARGKADTPNVLKSIYGWGEGLERDRLRALFGNDTAALARFEARMQRELDMVRSRNFIAGGSQTFDKASEGAALAGVDIGQSAVNAGQMGAVAATFNAARTMVAGRAQTGLGAGARGELADILTRGSDDEVLAFLRELEGIRYNRALRSGPSALLGGGSAVGATTAD